MEAHRIAAMAVAAILVATGIVAQHDTASAVDAALVFSFTGGGGTLDPPGFGSAVATGHVNGDPWADFIVGSAADNVGGNDMQGHAYANSGVGGSNLYTLTTPTPQLGAEFGKAVASGDVDGDGADDIIVGAPGQDVGAYWAQGRVFVFSGASGSLLRTIDRPTSKTLAMFGDRLASGDVNGDGMADVVVGAPSDAVGGLFDQGRAYVFSGADGSLLYTLDSPTPGSSIQFGYSIALGDVNGDHKSDIAVGTPGQGLTYIFSGADGSLLRTLGTAGVRATGDVDGDGRSDIAAAISPGELRVYSGADGSTLLTLVTPSPQTDTIFGFAAAMKDVNRDGKADVIVGAPYEDVGTDIDQGRAYAFSGADGSLLLTFTAATEPQMVPQGVGWSIAVGDGAMGTTRIAIGAPLGYYRLTPHYAVPTGKTYVYAGLPLGVGGVAAQPDASALPMQGGASAGDHRAAYVLGGAAAVLAAAIGGAWAAKRRRTGR